MLPIESIETRLELIQNELIHLIKNRLKNSYTEVLEIKQDLIIDNRKITHAYYHEGWKTNDVWLYYDYDNREEILLSSITNIYDLLNIYKIINYEG